MEEAESPPQLNPPRALFVIGPTGTGKTKAAIALAKMVESELISADSMQVYQEIPIISNQDQPTDIPIHLINYIPYDYMNYNVYQWREDALKKIKTIIEKGKIPIIVGGTMLYIYSLLFPHELLDLPSMDHSVDLTATLSDDQAKQQLKLVDPQRYQWIGHDNRKVRRSLSIYLATQKTHSEWISLSQPSSLPFQPIIFTLSVAPTLYNHLITQRAQSMIDRGVVDELKQLSAKYLSTHTDIPTSKGIFQVIGYASYQNQPDLTSFQATLIQTTLKYSKVQSAWIRNKIHNRIACIALHYEKDFQKDVIDKALKYTQLILAGRGSEVPMGLNEAPSYGGAANAIETHCQYCNKTLFGAYAWKSHQKGKRHKMQVRKARQMRSPQSVNALKKREKGCKEA